MTNQEKVAKINDYLSGCNGTDEYHPYNQFFASALLTDGIKLMCETYEAYWLIDLILSYQTREFKIKYDPMDYPLQYWSLKLNGKGGCTVKMDYIEDMPVIIQEVESTDFPEDFKLKFNAYDKVITTYQED